MIRSFSALENVSVKILQLTSVLDPCVSTDLGEFSLPASVYTPCASVSCAPVSACKQGLSLSYVTSLSPEVIVDPNKILPILKAFVPGFILGEE